MMLMPLGYVLDFCIYIHMVGVHEFVCTYISALKSIGAVAFSMTAFHLGFNYHQLCMVTNWILDDESHFAFIRVLHK